MRKIKNISTQSSASLLASKVKIEDPTQVIHYILVDDIEADPDQPRKSLQKESQLDRNISTEALQQLEELAADIAVNGLLQPISVREIPNNKYVVVIGERRWRAFLLNQSKNVPNSDKIPAIVRQDLKDRQMRIVQLAENIQRSNLTDLEVAQFINKMLKDNPDLKKSQIAATFNKSPQWVSRLLAILDPKHLPIFEQGLMESASVFDKFKALNEESQNELIDNAKINAKIISSEDIRSKREEEIQQSDGDSNETSETLQPSVTEKEVDKNFSQLVQQVEDEVYTPVPVKAKSPNLIRSEDKEGSNALDSMPVVPSSPSIINTGAFVGKLSMSLASLQYLLSHKFLKNKNTEVNLLLEKDELINLYKSLTGETVDPENAESFTIITEMMAILAEKTEVTAKS